VTIANKVWQEPYSNTINRKPIIVREKSLRKNIIKLQGLVDITVVVVDGMRGLTLSSLSEYEPLPELTI